MTVYKSKVDGVILSLQILFATLLCTFYLVILTFTTITIYNRIIEATIFLAMLALVWSTIWIKYEFKSEFLYIRSGFLRSKIPYPSIKRVAIAKNVLKGYRVLASREAIEIYYPEGIWGSVKISPDNMEAFLKTLEERCPNVRIDSNVYEKYLTVYEGKK